MLEVGTEAPAFELANQDGDPVALADHRGEWVVLYFYPRAATEGCTTEARGFRDEREALADRDAVVLGVSDDPVADLADFADEEDLPFDLLSDPDGEVASAYDSYGEKTTFGNTDDGVFRNTYVVDPDGHVAAVFEDVSPDGHAGAVLDVLDDLQAGG
ncbi:MAG: thioredoxin-dependent thiol peroxidase [Halobacteriaceae archaeon]